MSTYKVAVIGDALRRMMRGLLEIDSAVPASAFTGSRILSEGDLKALEAILNAEPAEGAEKP